MAFLLDEQEWVGHWAGRKAGAVSSQLAALPQARQGRGGLEAAAGTSGSARRSLLRSCCRMHHISFHQPLWTSHVTGLHYLSQRKIKVRLRGEMLSQLVFRAPSCDRSLLSHLQEAQAEAER